VSELVGEGHEDVAADSHLDVLFGSIGFPSCKVFLERFKIGGINFRNGYHLKLDTYMGLTRDRRDRGLLKKCLLLSLRGAIATKQSKKVRNNPPQAG